LSIEIVDESENILRDSLTSIGKRIAFVRNKLDMSQQEFAIKLGYKVPGAISRIEKNLSPPSIPSLVLLAITFNVDIHWILTGKLAPGVMVAEDSYFSLANQLSAYVGTELLVALDERKQLIKQREALESDPENNQTEIESLRGQIQTVNESLRKISKDMFRLSESPFGGNVWAENPTPIEKIVMPKPKHEP
jgi:transcriptional regulator with XRE-family HTH domain